MIPLQLTLSNFFSYQHATLDFSGLHTACICGENGAGKSSLLEAIAWAVWGKSRAKTEDDAIRLGEKEVYVEFTFQYQEQVFRILRSRRRGQSAALEFQVQTAEGFRAITAKGVRDTQQKIIDVLKLDYDTFIHSAYLRQGHADDFMLKRPRERKQVLADLLKLDRYDKLAERARDISKQAKGQLELMERHIEQLDAELDSDRRLDVELADAERAIATLQQQQTQQRATLQTFQQQQAERQAAQQQLDWQCQQRDRRHADRLRDVRDRDRLEQQLARHQQLLDRAEEIRDGCDRYQTLQARDRQLSQSFEQYRDASDRRNHCQQQLDRALAEAQQQQHQSRAQLSECDRQIAELEPQLHRKASIDDGLQQLQHARAHLSELERRHAEAAPLMQRRDRLQAECDRVRARLEARLDQLHQRERQLHQQQQQRPQLEHALHEIGTQIDDLEKLRVYHKRVKEKGLERRSFLDALHANQSDYERQLAEMDRKIEMLQVPDAACPLCDRPLDEHHWGLVSDKHQAQHRDILHQIWVIKEQIAISDREIQVLRQEYSQIDRQLADYDNLRERRGQLQAQLAAQDEDWEALQTAIAERHLLETQLQDGDYAPDERAELNRIERQLSDLAFDERELALARGSVDRLRWAEIQQAQLQQVEANLKRLQQQRPQLQAHLAEGERQVRELASESELARELADLQRYLGGLNYDRQEHDRVRSQLRDAQSWLTQHDALETARAESPQLQERHRELSDRLEQSAREIAELETQIAAARDRLKNRRDRRDDIERQHADIQQRQTELNRQQMQLGRLQQQQQQRQAKQAELKQQRQQLAATRRQHWVYKELAQAFGKNGIQALTIETVLPQLEAETNQLLARLSANQLHVQFVTQRASKGSKKSQKLIDTLDIYIADARGTRPYETYSGGEAFRIDFAIRLALAKLLAQRSGAALQLLVVDEGFGTQDDRGCERLISSIQAIASDFACILAVTHIPHLKEAFETRVEVTKTEAGSQVCVVN